jgi:hypothetical protein
MAKVPMMEPKSRESFITYFIPFLPAFLTKCHFHSLRVGIQNVLEAVLSRDCDSSPLFGSICELFNWIESDRCGINSYFAILYLCLKSGDCQIDSSLKDRIACLFADLASHRSFVDFTYLYQVAEMIGIPTDFVFQDDSSEPKLMLPSSSTE